MDSQIKIWDLKVGHGGLHLRPRVSASKGQCDLVLIHLALGVSKGGERVALCVGHERSGLWSLGRPPSPAVPVSCPSLKDGGGHLRGRSSVSSILSLS